MTEMILGLARRAARRGARPQRAPVLDTQGAWRDRFPYLLLAVLPLVLLAANQSWIWDNPDFNDPSVYIGFYRHYLEFKWPYIANYKASRLPLLLPGVALYRLLPAVVAHHGLYLSFLIGETWLVYAFLARRFGARLAFVVAAAVATSTFSHAHTSYHNQAAAAYFIAALVLLERPSRWPWWLRAAAAGGALALDVTTDSVVVAMVPMFGLCLLGVIPTPRGAGRLAVAGIAVALGGAAALAAVGISSRALGGPFLFFLDQVRYSAAVAKANVMSSVSLPTFVTKIWTFRLLALPLLVTCGALVLVALRPLLAGLSLLAVRVGRVYLDAAGVLAVGFLASMGAAVAMQVKGLGFLEHETLFQPFHVVTYLGLAAIAGGRTLGPLGGRFALLVAALFVVPLAGFGAPLHLLVTRAARARPALAGGVPFVFALALVAGGLGWLWRRRVSRKLVVLAAALGLGNALSTTETQPSYVYQARLPCRFRGDTFQALLEVDDALESFDPTNHARLMLEWGYPFEVPFDGHGWCSGLPTALAANAALLPRYFYTSAELARGYPDERPLDKVVMAATSPARLNELVVELQNTVAPTQALALRIDRAFVHSTFVIYLRAYDVVAR